jgi:hypothetical protein
MPDHDKLNPESIVVTGHTAGESQPPRQLTVGDIVGGKYKIKSIIGRGGMGVVYCAEDLVFYRDYALKALAPERVNQFNWQRFQTEGKVIARLEHRNIVKVYDMGIEGPDCLYYVMDLLQGVSLSDLILERGGLETGEALEIFSQICDGLGYAHKLGLIHRDVKPTNIILCKAAPGASAPVAKIIDYGLVKLVGEADRLNQSQTATGLICGSPLYMSPEQSMGGNIDERSDIYSLGCTMFECLTGQPPFCGSNGLATALMHQNDAPPRLSDLRPEKKYPQNLEQMIGRMLQKIPAQRYQSMEQVAQDLGRVRKGHSINREAIHNEGALFELNADTEPVPEGKKVSVIALFCCLGVLASIAIGWTVVYFCFPPPAKHSAVGAVPAPAVIEVPFSNKLQKEPKVGDEKIGQEFDKWPQISNGVVSRDGQKIRLFSFPPDPVGFICFGGKKLQARGVIKVPADQLVTLNLSAGEGLSARSFPKLLAKIGPEDIAFLDVKGPRNVGDDDEVVILPELINAVSTWKALQRLDFYHATLSKQTTLALNQLHPVRELNLHNAVVDGDDLAQLKWLKQLKSLDLKGVKNIDPVLQRLRASTALVSLKMDCTEPSREALLGLTLCPNLTTLQLSASIIGDDQLAVICNIPNLQGLKIAHCHVTPRALEQLRKLKKLRSLDVGPIAAPDIDKLKTLLPSCSIIGGLPNLSIY